ncbi:MAG: sugar phosphate isomerase/epimerase family protein [Aureliella sp.]
MTSQANRPKISAFPKCYLDRISAERSMSVFDWIEMSQVLDADGLEMYEGFFTSLEDSYLDEVGAAIRDAGYAMPMLCCSPDFTSPSPSDREKAISYQKQMIQVAHRLGGSGVVCRVLSGQRWPAVSREQGLEYASTGIRSCLDLAEDLGVVLGLENHYKDGYWKYAEFAQKQDVFLDLLSMIPDSANFGVQYDPSNAVVAGDDPVQLLEAVVGRVVSMHASDRFLIPGATLDDLKQAEGSTGYTEILQHGVTGQGINDYTSIFRILSQSDYCGWISIEDGMNGMEDMAASLQFLRQSVDHYWGS